MLPPAGIDRLVRCLALLSSSHDGEVCAAGRAADRLVRSSGLTWQQVFEPLLSPPPAREACAWRDLVEDLLDNHAHRLSQWERGFLESLGQRWRDDITDRQAAKLRQIARKCGVHCAF